MNTPQSKKDIPIRFASIGWTDAEQEGGPFKKGVIVVDKRYALVPDQYMCSAGADYTEWQDEAVSDNLRIAELLRYRTSMVKGGIDINVIDEALSVIPEYRERKQPTKGLML